MGPCFLHHLLRFVASEAIDKPPRQGYLNQAGPDFKAKESGMTEKHVFDEELGRLLEAARHALPPRVEQYHQQPTQASAWPWQVPQLPAQTSDHTPPTPK
jgi:hypothetical protein